MFRYRLKELRKGMGLSQQQLAEMFHIAQSTVGNWESGKREPDFKTISRLARFFSVSADYLLGNSDDPAVLGTKKDAPDPGTPEWTRYMYKQIGIDVDDLTDAQVDILVKNTGSLAKMFRDELAKDSDE